MGRALERACPSAGAAVTECNTAGDFLTEVSLLPVLEAGNSRARYQQDSVSGEDCLPGLQVC